MSSIEKESKKKENIANSEISCKSSYNEEFIKSHYDKIQDIEILIKALGTMIIFPDEVPDPVNIGKKIYRGTKQQPILLDKQRELALNKLSTLLEQL